MKKEEVIGCLNVYNEWTSVFSIFLAFMQKIISFSTYVNVFTHFLTLKHWRSTEGHKGRASSAVSTHSFPKHFCLNANSVSSMQLYMVCSVTSSGRNDLLNCCWVWSHWGLDNQQHSEMYPHCNHRRILLRVSLITSRDASSIKTSENTCLSPASGILLYLCSHRYVHILCSSGPTYTSFLNGF